MTALEGIINIKHISSIIAVMATDLGIKPWKPNIN